MCGDARKDGSDHLILVREGHRHGTRVKVLPGFGHAASVYGEFVAHEVKAGRPVTVTRVSVYECERWVQGMVANRADRRLSRGTSGGGEVW